MKLIVATATLACLFGNAAAFSPAFTRSSASTQLKSMYRDENQDMYQDEGRGFTRYANELGTATGPTGYFDPLGLAENLTPEEFARVRAGEIKNGRVAMLAVVGYVVPECFRFRGEIYPGLEFKDVPNGLAAINAIPGAFWIVLFFCIGAVDFLNSDESGYITTIPGPQMSDEDMDKRREYEIGNGRLAMLAIFELARHDGNLINSPGMDGDGIFSHLLPGLPFIYE